MDGYGVAVVGYSCRATGLVQRLQPVATMTEEIHGFRYRDSRDLTGFINGTENPKGRARALAALIGDEDRPFADGSYVAVQRYAQDPEDSVGWTTESRNGSLEERSGAYYAAYTKSFDAFDLMLARMMTNGESLNGSLFIHQRKFLFYR